MAEVTEKSFPFDADEINGKYDRSYLAEDFARYFQAFISSGVFMAESTNLQVMENGGMNVILKPGKMIIDGYRYDNLDDIIIQIEPADGVLKRIDRISATWSKEDKDIHCTLQKGVPSYDPVPPKCRRNNDTKDYVLADVYIEAGAISIYQKDITDQRLNSEICGVANPFNNIDTTSIFLQFKSWLDITIEKGEEDVAALVKNMEEYLELLETSGDNQLNEILEIMRNFENSSEEEFGQWFENIRGQLSEDAAGNLQNQITDLMTNMEESIARIETPDFDDTGEVEGIESFADFMSSFVKGTSIYQLFANLKAGLKYVLHMGMLVNNGTCETPGQFPLDAAYGKTLTDMITGLYSDLENIKTNAVFEYNVTYVFNKVLYKEKYRKGETVLYPQSFNTTLSGATFLGWTDNPNNMIPLTEKLMENSSITLYAIYQYNNYTASNGASIDKTKYSGIRAQGTFNLHSWGSTGWCEGYVSFDGQADRVVSESGDHSNSKTLGYDHTINAKNNVGTSSVSVYGTGGGYGHEESVTSCTITVYGRKLVG